MNKHHNRAKVEQTEKKKDKRYKFLQITPIIDNRRIKVKQRLIR